MLIETNARVYRGEGRRTAGAKNVRACANKEDFILVMRALSDALSALNDYLF